MDSQSTCVIVDDHEVVRAGTHARLEPIEWIEVVGDANTASQAMDLLRGTQPTLALVDVRLPDGNGLQIAEQLIEEGIATRVVLYSATAMPSQVEQALEAGVAGFVLKDSPLATMVDALRAAREGRRYIDPTIAAEMMAPSVARRMSLRELEVLRKVADGGQNATIAFDLGISVETVKAHVSNILGKCDAQSRTHAVAKAMRDGVIN